MDYTDIDQLKKASKKAKAAIHCSNKEVLADFKKFREQLIPLLETCANMATYVDDPPSPDGSLGNAVVFDFSETLRISVSRRPDANTLEANGKNLHISVAKLFDAGGRARCFSDDFYCQSEKLEALLDFFTDCADKDCTEDINSITSERLSSILQEVKDNF